MSSLPLIFFEKISDPQLLLGPLVYWFSSFFWGKNIFIARSKILKKESLRCFQKILKIERRTPAFISNRGLKFHFNFQFTDCVFKSENFVFTASALFSISISLSSPEQLSILIKLLVVLIRNSSTGVFLWVLRKYLKI